MKGGVLVDKKTHPIEAQRLLIQVPVSRSPPPVTEHCLQHARALLYGCCPGLHGGTGRQVGGAMLVSPSWQHAPMQVAWSR